MKKLLLTTAFSLSSFAASAADLPSRTPAPAPMPPSVSAKSWTGFYAGVNVGYLRTQNKNDLQYIGATPNSLSFNELQRITRVFPLQFGDSAIRSLSTPTPGSLSGPFPLFATADSPFGYYGLLSNTNGGLTPPNETAQINDRSTAANQTALDSAVANNVLPASLVGQKRDHFTGGALIGYNYQISSIVVGVEADFSYMGRSADASYAGGAPVVVGVNPLSIAVGGGDYITSNALITGAGNNEALWLGTVRGRLGFTFNNALVYATGGLAFGRVRSTASIAVNDSFLGVPTIDAVWSGSYSKTRLGWALGAGFQYAISENWSLKAEYLHYDLGVHSYSLNASNPDNVLPYDSGDYAINIRAKSRTAGDIVRIGVNFRFATSGSVR